MSIKINRLEEVTIRAHWYADDLLKQCPSKGDKYVIEAKPKKTGVNASAPDGSPVPPPLATSVVLNIIRKAI